MRHSLIDLSQCSSERGFEDTPIRVLLLILGKYYTIACMNPNTTRYLLLLVALGGLLTVVFWYFPQGKDEVAPTSSTVPSEMSQIFNPDMTVRTTTIAPPENLDEFFEQLMGIRP